MRDPVRNEDYLYATARLRALETRLPTRELWNQLLHARGVAEARALLASHGLLAAGVSDDEALAALMADAVTVLGEVMPQPLAVAFLRYPTDCNNIKICIKCALRGISAEGLLEAGGTLDTASLFADLERGDVSHLPTHMGAAVAAARTAFAQTHDAGEIDRILDAACFADMRDSAAGMPFCRTLLSLRADLTNLITTLRLLRMGGGAVARARLQTAFVTGGSITLDTLSAALDGGERVLFDAVYAAGLSALTAGVELSTVTAGELERRADNIVMQHVKRARQVLFGVEVPVAYLVAWQYTVKNLRILLHGKEAGADAETLRERMRDSYV